MNYYWGNSYAFLPAFMAFKALFIPFAILDLVLKGFALYRSARKGQTYWFIALLVINSIGILPAIYLLTHKEAEKKVVTASKPRSKKK